jgi:hypothetical protein
VNPAIIIAAIEGVIKLIGFIKSVTANNAVTAAWTPEERTQVDARWAGLLASPAWQTDTEKAAAGGGQ